MRLEQEVSLIKRGAIGGGIAEASKTATDVITEIGSTGIKIHPSGQSGAEIVDYTQIDADGMEVYQGGDMVAAFGASGAQVGSADSSHIELSADHMSIVNDDGATMFNVDMDAGSIYTLVTSDAQSYTYESTEITATGTTSVTHVETSEEFTVGSGSTLTIQAGIISRLEPIVNRPDGTGILVYPTLTSGSGLSYSTRRLRTTSPIVLSYGTASTTTLTATLSLNVNLTDYGRVTSTFDVTVTFAYGGAKTFTLTEVWTVTTTALGTDNACSISFPPSLVIPPVQYMMLTSGAALTFGTRQDGSANGLLSSSFGEGLIASSEKQAVFGKYNEEDTNGDYALIIGNGTADNARSNALAVKWDGTAVDNDGLMVTRSPAKLLWEGTWSAGDTKTVSGLHKYTILACATGGASYIPAIAPPGTTDIRFYGGYGNATPNQFLYTATFTRTASDSDSMTLVACYESNVHGSTKTASSVTKIWGIC